MSFAGVKANSYEKSVKMLNKLLVEAYRRFSFLTDSGGLDEQDREAFRNIRDDMDETEASFSLKCLSELLEKYYGKKVLIFLDEYDTPLQEAYVGGYWDEMVTFIRSLFNNTFKTNPSLERAVMTGITRVSKESIFSDLNNLTVVTTTSDKYATAFGFTEEEVFNALDAQGIPAEE